MNDSRELTHLNIIVLVAGGGAEIAIQEYQLPRVLDIGRIRLAISFRGTQPRFSLSSAARGTSACRLCPVGERSVCISRNSVTSIHRHPTVGRVLVVGLGVGTSHVL